VAATTNARALSGWKEIAVHLNQGMRTVQRWESLGLPVHRLGSGKRAPVVAFVEELNAWEKTAPRRLLDEVIQLKAKIGSLEAEVASLKGELRFSRVTKFVKNAHTYSTHAHNYSTHARASSDGHSRDLREIKRLGTEAAKNVKQGRMRQQKREATSSPRPL
jgi:hypothetical protein